LHAFLVSFFFFCFFFFYSYLAAARDPHSPAPIVFHRDDTRGSLMTGCLLRMLFTPREKLTTLTSNTVTELTKSSCSIGIHVRFGDKYMYRFDSGATGPDQSDARLIPNADAVKQPLDCAINTAKQVCRSNNNDHSSSTTTSSGATLSPLPSLTLYIATDTPAAYPWFQTSISSYQNKYRNEFSSISLIRSEHGPPGHVGAFLSASDKEREQAESQLLSDWYLLTKNNAVITTGSILSFSAAAMAGEIPIRANTCKPDW
jgi:hypothetical protein